MDNQETERLTLTFKDNRLAREMYGAFDENLIHLEKRLGVALASRGNEVTITGAPALCDEARHALERLYKHVKLGLPLTLSDVDAALKFGDKPFEPLDNAKVTLKAEPISASLTTRKRMILPRTPMQATYLAALKSHEMVFGLGPAGTGKTWMAVAYAVSLLETGKVQRIIITRPAVEAGERLGFLPGDLKEKVDPYLRPIYDALYDVMEASKVEKMIAAGILEIAPLAFMRGRTLSHAIVLVDEAQNTTAMQMKMVLTRFGENCRMIITGDPKQVDLPNGTRSGLSDAVEKLAHIEAIKIIRFSVGDVVRHPLVGHIVAAYEGA
jgi:phosphate starvation-inducible protein PhoH and related proteins